MDIDRIDLSEVSELEPLVISSLERIEEGLKSVDSQLSIGRFGRPDVLAVDSEGTLAILELKSITADTSAISQSIRYYDWFVQNVALVARPFPDVKPDMGVRILIVAPGFDEDIVRIAKYLDLDISLVKYISVKNTKTGEVGIVYDTLELERTEGPAVQFRSIEDIISYFAEASLTDEFQKVLSDLQNAGIQISPYKGGKDYWVECTFDGEAVGYLQPRKKYFNCQTYDEGKEEYIWPPRQMKSHEQWIQECRRDIVDYANANKEQVS